MQTPKLPRVNKFAPKPGEDLIDFACSPDFVRHYASQGMTPDYPPDYYRLPDTMTVEKIRELEARIKDLEGKKAIIKYVMPIEVQPKVVQTQTKAGVSLRIK